MDAQTVMLRIKSDFLTKLDTKGREQIASWTVPWLPVDKELVVSDEHHRIRIVMEPRQPIGRPRGTTLVTNEQFIKDYREAEKPLIGLPELKRREHGRPKGRGRWPGPTVVAKVMGFDWWHPTRCDVSGHRGHLSQDILDRCRSAQWLVVAARIQGELAK